ncbi:MAG: YdcF family protein, partial [Terriglobales bacterium]
MRISTTIAVLITQVTKLAPLSVSGNMQSEMQLFRRHIISLLVIVIVLILIFAALASQAARFLVLDEPEKSDAIVVLAGETSVRPARALELLRQGMAPHMFLDAETRDVIYDQRLTDIAQKYANSLPEANRISVCPIIGFSTFAEADDVSRCLRPLGAHRVLIVTSDFHTRRALAIFRHRLPQYQFSVAAASGPGNFGDSWWTNREWAKTTLDEWMKTLW